jgi:tetratricopeptide (TPR) repeat protein
VLTSRLGIPAALILILSAACHCLAEEPAEFEKALALRSEGKNDRALAALKRCTIQWPQHAKAYVHMGGILEDQGKWKDAANAYRSALEMDPGNASAMRNLEQLISLRTVEGPLPAQNPYKGELLKSGLQALEGKDYTKALEVFRLLRGLFPDDPRPLFYSAQALEGQGKASHAIALYERIVELFPDYGAARVNLIIALMSKGDKEAAARNVQKALPVMQENRRLNYLAGLLGCNCQTSTCRRSQGPP